MNPFDNMSALEDGFKGSRSSTISGTESRSDDKDWIARFKASVKSARDFHETKLQTAWSRNYRAFQNRHFSGSKYDTTRYKNRSKIFKTRTRSAVRKNDATAAQAMFSTEDVVSVTAERSSDKLQATTARFLHEALNYRLDRSNRWAGPSWFLTAIGARQDAQITGICVSKQYWEYEERLVPTYVDVTSERMALDATGAPMIDLLTGQPVMEEFTEEQIEDQIEVVRDRLMITLFPPEHAMIDRTGDWRDPIQEGGTFIASYPMRLDDVEDIINQQSDRNKMGGRAWRSDIDVSKLRQARTERSQQAASVRRARGDGIDRFDSAFNGKDNEVVWLYECFYRKDGEDWHFWMLGEDTLLSDPCPTIESYPEQKGDRPYVRGLGALETHKTHPMAPVESWQPAQIEINDVTNLALDAMKMAISPITKIKRGRGVDLKQVQNRGPDAAVMVQDLDDVSFDRAPDPSGNAQQYINVLSNDFDELAGVFSNGSVQSNRMLNETVGGMQLLSNSASALTEFDLRVWVETWTEPCLAQCLNCIMRYESDEIVIAVAGERAGLIENIVAGQGKSQGKGLDPQKEQAEAEEETFEPPVTISDVLDNLDNAQVSVRVNVGIGALDSNQRMQKFMTGMKATMELMPALQDQGIDLNASAIIQEAWGLAGYKDADRFFVKGKDKKEGPPPEIQIEMLRQKGRMSEKQMEAKAKMETAKSQDATKMQIEQMRASLDAREVSLQEREFEHQQRMDELSMAMQRQEKAMNDILGAIQGNAPQRLI